MIPGIVASQASDEAIIGIPEPLADIQFDIGSYVISGSPVDLEDIVDRPENVIPGQGVVLAEAFSVELLGALAALLTTADWTVAIEWYRPESFSTPLEVNTGPGVPPFIRIEDSNGYFLAFDSYADPGSHERDLDGDSLTGPVSRGIALRRTDTEFAMSLDAANIVENNVLSSMPTLTRAWIGGDEAASYGLVVVQRIRVWASSEVMASMLPQISAAAALGIPACDAFASAVPIESGQTLYIITIGATKETGEPNHGGEAGGASVWLEFVAPASESYTVDLNEWTLLSGPIVAVYTGSAIGSLTPVVSDVDDTWTVTFSATMGTSYKIALDGVAGEEGFFSISVASAAAGGDDELLLLLL
jgi:hypothetical protein